MFVLGDKVQIDPEFEGSIVIAGWNDTNLENHLFEIVSLEEFCEKHPRLAKKVKNTRGKNTFLKCVKPDNNEIFVIHPSTALEVVEEAPPICRCPVKRLWAGLGHYTGCVEN